MKYLSEYRNPEAVQQYLKEIHGITTRPWTLMEICGGQTHSQIGRAHV
jgi:hydrogenase expression/formation protein HypD